MDISQVKPEVDQILQSHFEIAPEMLTEDAQIYGELGLDSLDGADLLALLESKLGQSIDPELFLDARSLGDVYRIVSSLVTT